MSGNTWTVWVGGSEVNDHYITYEEAVRLAEIWKADGYEDTQITNTEGQQ